MEVKVHDSAEDVAIAVATVVADAIADSEGQFTLGLAGGSTPEATYLQLAELDVPWESVTTWMTDERWVPHDDPRNNGRMATETLIGKTAATLLRPDFDPQGGPEVAAERYERELRELFGESGPDLALLGMGSDGHTASLFPGSAALDEEDRIYVANTIPETSETRLTASYPLLWQIRQILVIVVGDSKAEALRDSLAGDTPAGRLAEGQGEVVWHVDEAAASLL